MICNFYLKSLKTPKAAIAAKNCNNINKKNELNDISPLIIKAVETAGFKCPLEFLFKPYVNNIKMDKDNPILNAMLKIFNPSIDVIHKIDKTNIKVPKNSAEYIYY